MAAAGDKQSSVDISKIPIWYMWHISLIRFFNPIEARWLLWCPTGFSRLAFWIFLIYRRSFFPQPFNLLYFSLRLSSLTLLHILALYSIPSPLPSIHPLPSPYRSTFRLSFIVGLVWNFLPWSWGLFAIISSHSCLRPGRCHSAYGISSVPLLVSYVFC